jgi:ABC-2 type transport system permease protein
MRKVWIISRHEFLTNVRRPSFIIMTVLIPVVGLAGLLIAAFAGGGASSFLASQFGSESKPIAVVDQSGEFTPVLPDYEDEFQLYAGEHAARDALKAGANDVMIIIPADYIEKGNVTVVAAKSDFMTSMVGESGLAQSFVTDHLLRDVTTDSQLRERLRQPITRAQRFNLEGEEITQRGIANVMVDFMIPYFLAIFLIITIFSTSGFLLQSVSQEKTSRVIEVVLSSVTAWELLMGKVIGLGLLGLTRVVIWVGSAFLLSGGAVAMLGISMSLLTRPEILILSSVYYLLGFMVFAILMAASGAIGTTQQEAQQVGGIFTLIAAIPMWIAGLIFTSPNAPIARLFSWFPLTAPTMMLLRLPLGTVPVEDVVISIVGCILAIPLLVWAGSKVFRMGLLIYNKRPTLAQIVQVIRQA